ncbi:MAG: hypothetical protein JJ896_01810 [Rhodothermales bacterium]|nr:hypothetical protein [Rhodothermales bacterium]MBO6778364.1 hypothetical protein [Rhodothermales bacterium]
MTPIPFSLPDDGFTERKGSVRLIDGYVEIRLQTSLMGEFNKEERIFKIEAATLEDAHLTTGWFKDKICLAPKNDELFEGLPGFLEGEVKLSVWRKHRQAGLQLIDHLQRAIVGF